MKKNNKKGFTLVELVIVVAVMAILVAVAIPTVSSVTSKARNSVYESNCQTVESILKLAESEAKIDGETTTVNYKEALEDAKLGITDGKYFYNTETGEVSNNEPTKGYTIVFDDDGGISVTAISSTSTP